MREAINYEDLNPVEFVYLHEHMGIKHNYLCAVCKEKSAVINCNNGILGPCWSCQNKGYRIIKLNWLDKLLGRGL